MMTSSNVCIFQGRISNDIKFSSNQYQTPNGPQTLESAKFNVAVDRALSSAQRQKAKQGDKSIKTTDFIPCSLSGPAVATLKQYFYKGKGIHILGHLEEYTTTNQQTGQTTYGHTIVCEKIDFCIQDPKNGQQTNNTNNNGYDNNSGYDQNQYAQGYNGGYNDYQQPQQQAQMSGFSMFDESSSPF